MTMVCRRPLTHSSDSTLRRIMLGVASAGKQSVLSISLQSALAWMVTKQASKPTPHWVHNTCDRARPAGNAATNECYQHCVSDSCKHSWCQKRPPQGCQQHTASSGTHKAVAGRKYSGYWGIAPVTKWVSLQATWGCRPRNDATNQLSFTAMQAVNEECQCCALEAHKRTCSNAIGTGGNRAMCRAIGHARLSAGQAHIGCVDPVGAGDGVMVNTCNNTEWQMPHSTCVHCHEQRQQHHRLFACPLQ